MPYKNQTLKLKIPKKLNGTIKLDDDTKAEIKSIYGTISQRKLAKLYGVSRRTIIFIGCPEKYEKSKERMRINKYYYSKDKVNKWSKATRHKRQELYLKKELI